MKTTDKILYSPKEGTSGFWGLRNVPKEPNSNSPAYHPIDNTLYENALESCKANSLEIVNPEEIVDKHEADNFPTYFTEKYAEKLHHLKSGDIFDLPEGYNFKDQWQQYIGNLNSGINGSWKDQGDNFDISEIPDQMKPKYRKVLRLVKTETKAQPVKTLKEAKEKIAAATVFKRWENIYDELSGTDEYAQYLEMAAVELEIALAVPQPKPEESQYWLWDEVDNIFQANKSDEAMRICERKFTIQRKKQ